MRARAKASAALFLVAVMASAIAMTDGRRQSAPTPLQLFQRMLPAVRHPRCVNCHGGVDPINTGRGHPPGKIDTVKTHTSTYQPCEDCHMKGWSLPADDHAFVAKTDQELCALFSEFAMKQGHARFIDNHLIGDELIVAAFEGLAGGARDTTTDKADKPPMDHDTFVKLGRDWVDRGQGACELSGTIVLEETVTSQEKFHIAPEVDNTIAQEGKRTVTITLRGGKYYADIKTQGQIRNRSVAHLTNQLGQPCVVDQVIIDDYEGSTTGPAEVVIKDTVFFGDTEAPQTDYRIDIILPEETTRKKEHAEITNTCGILVPPYDPDDQSFEWNSFIFTIEGHVEDPRRDGRAGACDKMVKHGDVGSERVEDDRSKPCFRYRHMGNSWTPGLMDRGAAIAYHDGSDIPFHVAVRWNLKFR